MEDLQEMVDQDTQEGSVEETVETSGDLDNNTDPNDETNEETDPNDVSSPDDGTDTATEEATPSRQGFDERAEVMGLTPVGEEGAYHYSDEFSEVLYRLLQTGSGAGENLMDDMIVPPVGLFTKPAGIDGTFGWVGIISPYYKFEGNEVLINRIRESISAVGNPIMSENTVMAPNLASIRHEIVIQSATNVPTVGDIYPQLIVTNSYDGTRAAHIAFGLAFNDGQQDVRFCAPNKLGSLRQIHLEGSQTTMQAEVGGYVTAFAGNIGDMIQANFNEHVTEEDMMKILDLIEKQSGKTRREAISAVITEENPTEGVESWTMTSWQLFHAITRFSTLETNLNAKKILESVAERVLVVPAQMMEAVAALSATS